MGYVQGNCGRSARHYGDELQFLYGLLTMESVWPREKEAKPDPKLPVPPPTHCEHGVRLSRDCPDCTWMFGWKERDNDN